MFSGKKGVVLVGLTVLAASSIFGYFSLYRQPSVHPPKTVDYVDLQRYVGRWYQQGAIPASFQKGCVDTQAFYSIIDEKTIKVQNSCERNGKRGGKAAKGYVQDSTNSKLKVVFNPIFSIFGGGQYWIVKLGDAQNYGYAVVSSPDYRYLWILSREQKMDQETYNSIIDWLKEQGGFQVDKLVRTRS